MWVTSVDNYQQDGVVFKGNVRNKDPSAAYAKMKQRLAVGLGLTLGHALAVGCSRQSATAVGPGTSAVLRAAATSTARRPLSPLHMSDTEAISQ